MPSELIIKRIVILSEIEKMDIIVWQVPKSKDRPEGVKYSVNYRRLKNDEWVSRIRVDNSEGKGHHLHIDKQEEEFDFISIEETIKFVLNKRSELK